MIRVTITIEGSIEDIQPVLRALPKMNVPETHSVVADETAATGIHQVGASWTEGKVKAVWFGMTRDAQALLREIANAPNVYPYEQLKSKLGLTGNQIGGRLSSLGHQLRIKGCQDYPPPLTQPYTDNGSWGYKLNPVWRETILKMG